MQVERKSVRRLLRGRLLPTPDGVDTLLGMRSCTRFGRGRMVVPACALAAAAALCGSASAHATERIALRNGFSVTCDHREALDEAHVRLYLDAAATSYMDVPAAEIVAVERESGTPGNAWAGSPTVAVEPGVKTPGTSIPAVKPAIAVDALIASAGAVRSLNVDLLRSVVNAESGGHVRAVSRAGAQGLMQLMPATARSLGVADSFQPEENLRGGTDYLDTLLRRYHDDLPLALAAYNAGPGAVDRYHGVPPYRQTRLYVARIIREFNRRTLLAQREAAQHRPTPPLQQVAAAQ